MFSFAGVINRAVTVRYSAVMSSDGKRKPIFDEIFLLYEQFFNRFGFSVNKILN